MNGSLPSPAVAEDGGTAAQIRALVEPLRRVPDELRRFDKTPEVAAEALGIDAATLAILLDSGLPHIGSGSALLFDGRDLRTMSLYLRARSPQHDVMRFWLRSLRQISAGPVAYRVQIRTSCPVPRHSGACVYTLPSEFGVRREVVTEERSGATLGEIVCRTDQLPRQLPAEAAAIASLYYDVDYYYLPPSLTANADFVKRERIGDCLATARAIVESAAEAGLHARLAFGFILSIPVSCLHTWAEIRLGGCWYAVDPLMPKALQAWGIADGQEWQMTLSPFGLYHRISSEQIRLAWHGGTPSRAWLPTGFVR